MAWVNIQNKESALSVRNKINALGANVDTKATQSALNSLTATVETKADLVNGIVNPSQLYPNLDSYIAFCANVNINAIEAAFGKNNEDKVHKIGEQLAMYAWFRGDSKTTYPFTNLKTCDNLSGCLSNPSALNELVNNSNIMNLIAGSPYAMGLIAGNSAVMDAVAASALALNIFAKSATAKSALISNAAVFNAKYATMRSAMQAGTSYFAKTAESSNTNDGKNITKGTANSFVAALSFSDSSSTNLYNWEKIKHNHNQIELTHAAFPTGTGTGTVTPNVFAVGGISCLAAVETTTLTYSIEIYEAI